MFKHQFDVGHDDMLPVFVITATQFQNRMMLRSVMLRHGFQPIDSEWWHFTLANEPYPDTYFTFPVKRLRQTK